jgi:predicted PurR-regulated permease PerM
MFTNDTLIWLAIGFVSAIIVVPLYYRFMEWKLNRASLLAVVILTLLGVYTLGYLVACIFLFVLVKILNTSFWLTPLNKKDK